MLRSFSYVQQSAVRKFVHNDAEAARLAPLARAWELEVRAAFLQAYGEASQGVASVPQAPSGEGLLGLFEIEKAFYEARYELGLRPGWIGIPLQGILEWSSSDAKH
jgi:maltose alpha-D-glucosyltransferase/alpha-amylase